MKIKGTVALVTVPTAVSAWHSLGELLARGARKVYAGARDPSAVKQPGVQAIRLDVTKPDEFAAAAAHAGDVAQLINNAGISHQCRFLVGLEEVMADELTRRVKQGLTAPRPSYLMAPS